MDSDSSTGSCRSRVGGPGALAIDPNNTDVVYVGTSARVAAQPQAGLFKSTDGGGSWIRLGSGYPAGNTGNAIQFVNQWINVIIVDPANSNILYLASTSGCFRSTDGGLNWTAGVNAGGDVRSLVLDTSSPAGARILYAGISGRGVFRSNDGGQNWTQILSGATPAVAAAVGAGSRGLQQGHRRDRPADLAPEPRRRAGAVRDARGDRRRARSGRRVPEHGSGRHLDATDRHRHAHRHAGRIQLPHGRRPGLAGRRRERHHLFRRGRPGRSNDSGNTFTALAGLHADNHAWAFFPQPAPRRRSYSAATTAASIRSTDGGATWTSLSAGGLQTGLFYNLDMRPDATGSMTVGALQDNGTPDDASGAAGRAGSRPRAATAGTWSYDGATAGQVYCTSGFWSPAPCTRIWRSTDDGASFPTEITPWGTASDAGCYLGPLCDRPQHGRHRLRQRQPEPLAKHGRRRDVAKRRRFPAPAKWTSRRPTATTWSSASATGCSSRPTRWRDGGPPV